MWDVGVRVGNGGGTHQSTKQRKACGAGARASANLRQSTFGRLLSCFDRAPGFVRDHVD